jgi:hypothetical protein
MLSFLKRNANTDTMIEESVPKPEYLRSDNPNPRKNRRKPVDPVYLDPLDEEDLLDELLDYYYYDYDFIPSMKNLERYYRDYYRNQNKVSKVKKKRPIQQKRTKHRNDKHNRRKPQTREKKKNLIGNFDFYDYYDDFDYGLFSVAEKKPSDVKSVLNKVRNKPQKTTATTTAPPTTATTTAYSFQLNPDLLSNQIFNQMFDDKNFENFFREHKNFQDHTINKFRIHAQGNESSPLPNNVFRPTTIPSTRSRGYNHQVFIFSIQI